MKKFNYKPINTVWQVCFFLIIYWHIVFQHLVVLLACMTILAAIKTSIRFGIYLSGLFYCIGTTIKHSQVSSVKNKRQIIASFFMYLVVAICLGIFVYIIIIHHNLSFFILHMQLSGPALFLPIK